jgi:hypothetical protein
LIPLVIIVIILTKKGEFRMKKSLLLAISFGLLSITLVGAKRHDRQSLTPSCKTEQSCQDLNNNCLCFCAFKGVKGGYRHKLPNQDHPIFFKDAKQDKFGKRCYCAARDVKVLEAVAEGMPRHKAVKKYENYYSPSEKEHIDQKRARVKNS